YDLIALHRGKPGMVIGKGGSEIDKLRTALNKLTGKKVHINVIEVKKVDMDAKLVAESIARQLENRVSFRRAQKQALGRAIKAGQKVSKHKFLVVLAAQTSHVLKVTVKEQFHCIHFVLTLNMHMKKQIRHTANSVSKYGSTVEKFFLLRLTTSKGGN